MGTAHDGVGGSGYDWRHQIDKLADSGFRVIVPDLLGSGYTDHPGDGDYSPHGQAILLLGLMNRLGVDKVSIIGNSYGAGIGLVMAFHHPDRVERLALLDPAIIPQALPLAVMAAYLAWEGRLARMRQIFPPWSFLLSLAPALLWLASSAALAPDGFLRDAVVENLIARFFAGTSHARPFYYYGYQFPADFMPWTALWPLAGICAFRQLRGRAGDEREAMRSPWRFVLAWIAIPFAFINCNWMSPVSSP